MVRPFQTKQINIRVPADVEDVLEAARYVGRYRSIPELLLPEIERIASELAKQDEIRATVEQRRKRDAHVAVPVSE